MTWQREAAEGHQPWRYDARLTAVAFARDYLGYREIDPAAREFAGDAMVIAVGVVAK